MDANQEKILEIKLQGPALTHLEWSLLTPEKLARVQGIRFDCEGVHIMSSMVLARLMEIAEVNSNGLQIQFLNLEPEMRNLFVRTGLAHWMQTD